jgi:hypothetical protein
MTGTESRSVTALFCVSRNGDVLPCISKATLEISDLKLTDGCDTWTSTRGKLCH